MLLCWYHDSTTIVPRNLVSPYLPVLILYFNCRGAPRQLKYCIKTVVVNMDRDTNIKDVAILLSRQFTYYHDCFDDSILTVTAAPRQLKYSIKTVVNMDYNKIADVS